MVRLSCAFVFRHGALTLQLVYIAALSASLRLNMLHMCCMAAQCAA